MEQVGLSFGDTVALQDFDLRMQPGQILGLLGPNGSGKTTAVRVLATLLPPDSGRARVFGRDVVRDAAEVRSMISLAGQYAAVDELLTGRQNLRMFGELFGLSRDDSGDRSDELLRRFDLSDAGDRRVGGYSGGMRRRLDLASSLLTDQRLIFLDEPTTGLDLRSRRTIWDVIRDLAGSGATVLLTTQYLEEADVLADRIAVMDRGTVIAEGTSEELKAQSGGLVIDLVIRDGTGNNSDLDAAYSVVADVVADEVERTGVRSLAVGTGGNALARLAQVAAALDESPVEVSRLGLRGPDLDDVFLRLTGSQTSGEGQADGGTGSAEPPQS